MGAGPVGLALAIGLAEQADQEGISPEKLSIEVYELRLRRGVASNSPFVWPSRAEPVTVPGQRKVNNRRREQVVTLQDSTVQLFDHLKKPTRDAFQGDRVWLNSVNVAIRDLEDRLLARAQEPDVARYISLRQLPKEVQESVRDRRDPAKLEKALKNIRQWMDGLDCDVLVGADGSNSTVRSLYEEKFDVRRLVDEMSSGAKGKAWDHDYAVGVGFEDLEGWEPQDQSLNTLLTLAQNRYLFNAADGGRRGYVNVRLTKKEFNSLRTKAKDACSFAYPCVLWDVFKPNDSGTVPIYQIDPSIRRSIEEGLRFFNIPLNLPTTIVAFELDPTYVTNFSFTDGAGKEVYLIGDSAMSHHFWPGRGLNTGLRAAAGLTASLMAACRNDGSGAHMERFQDFMTKLREEEIGKRSAVMFSAPGELPQLPTHLNNAKDSEVSASSLEADRLAGIMVERVKGWRDLMEARNVKTPTAWPHLPVSDKQILDRFSGAQRPNAYVLKVMVDSGVANPHRQNVVGWALPHDPVELLPYNKGFWTQPAASDGAAEDRKRQTQIVTERLRSQTMRQNLQNWGERSVLRRLDERTGVMDPTSRYDFVLEVEDFSSILSEGWRILTPMPEMEGPDVEEPTTRFVIIGNFKLGKTWLLSKLGDIPLAAHEVVHTPGLCSKRLEVAKKACFILDVKGENTPFSKIRGNLSETLKDKRAEERFLRDIIFDVSDAFIYMVNNVGYNEQLTLVQLTEQLSSYTHGKPISTIIVVHNLRQLHFNSELKPAWQEVVDIYKAQGFSLLTEEVYDPKTGRMGLIQYLTKATETNNFNQIRSVTTQHYCLAAEDSEAGADNIFVFEKIKSIIKNCEPTKRSSNFVKDLQNTMTNKITDYVSTDTKASLAVRREGNCLKLFSEATREGDGPREPVPVKLRDFDLGTFTSIRQGDSGHNNALKVTETMDNKVRVSIDLPGFTKDEYAKQLTLPKGEQVVEITPEGPGVKVTTKPWLIPRELEPGERFIEGGKEASHVPPVTVHQRLKDVNSARYKVSDGVLTLQWDKDVGASVVPLPMD